MNAIEILFVFVIGLLVLLGPIVTLVLAIIAYTRSGQVKELAARVSRLESRLAGVQSPTSTVGPVSNAVTSPSTDRVNVTPVLVAQVLADPPAASLDTTKLAGTSSTPAIQQGLAPSSSADSAAVVTPIGQSEGRPEASEPEGWEAFVGQKAFGWMAVVLFVFSAAFFLRYAFQNNWIGPVGRVMIGELTGLAMAAAGVVYHRQGLKRFSSMLTAAGIVVLYLATWSAFGFYQLLPQSHAGVFLALLVFESMLVAVIYRSVAIAIAAVIGGLLTPILLASPHDTYWSLFSYLAILNLGVVAASLYRRWPLVASLALGGTQALFWGWYASQYHPEKFVWAIGFQGLIFALYLVHGVIKSSRGDQRIDIEELVRYVVNGLLGFTAFWILLRDDYCVWLGVMALALAALYAWAAKQALASKAKDPRLLLASLALALGFIAWALPLQANTTWYALARWVAMGWAIIGLALWRFGVRIQSPALRVMASVFGVMAVLRVLTYDLVVDPRELFIPVFNEVALPALIVAVCILYAVVSAGRMLERFTRLEQTLIGVGGVVGVVLVWLVLSLECYGYLVSRSLLDDQIELWRWRGQLALTVFWSAFATVLLVLGFRLQRARLRWLAIILYAITVCKLFMFDMANVQQLYRILGFFVLAVVLGLVARAYQRFR